MCVCVSALVSLRTVVRLCAFSRVWRFKHPCSDWLQYRRWSTTLDSIAAETREHHVTAGELGADISLSVQAYTCEASQVRFVLHLSAPNKN